MLVIYNESNIGWEKVKINDRISKFVTSRHLKNGKVRYIDILTSNDLSDLDVSDCINMDYCKTIYAGPTAARFQKKDLKPLIVATDKTNNDIVLVTIALNGRILKSVSNPRAGILNYMIAKSELIMAFSIRDFGEGYTFGFTVHDPNLIADTTYSFVRTGDEYVLTTSVSQVESALTAPSFKITKFRPSVPTNLIFVNAKDKDAFTSTYSKHNYHDVHYYNNEAELNDLITEYKANKYDAVTLFENSATMDNRYASVVTTIKSSFRLVNILFNNKKVYFI